MEGANSMKYEKPTMCCEFFDIQDIVRTSGLEKEGDSFGDILNPDDFVQ